MKLMSVRWSCLLLLLVGIAATTGVVSGADGRWKLGDDGTCYWDPADVGPDQCTPAGAPTGRWKLGGDGTCYFDANDSGPNQCEPPVTAPAAESADDFLASLPSSTAVPVDSTRSTAPTTATAGS
jgi:hypothetical protein